MTETQLVEALNNILAAMDQVLHRDNASHVAYAAKASALFSIVIPASYSEIEDPDVKLLIEKIWYRSFSKYQGERNNALNLKKMPMVMIFSYIVKIDYPN